MSRRKPKIRGTIEELELMANFKESNEFVVLKRWSRRYISNLRRVSFKLTEQDPHYLAIRHAELAGQALGIKTLIKMIEGSGKKLEKEG